MTVGGWSLAEGDDTCKAQCFSVELDKSNAPWAFARGEPLRAIASLELDSTLLSVVAFAPERDPSRSSTLRLTLSGTTDNQGNAFAVTRLTASKYPFCVILMELAVQLERRGLELRLCWAPRDQNMEADALTKDNFHDFDPAKRVNIDLRSMRFVVLDELLTTGEDLYKQITEHKNTPRRHFIDHNGFPPRKKRLKDQEPW